MSDGRQPGWRIRSGMRLRLSIAVCLAVAGLVNAAAAALPHQSPATYRSCGFYWNKNTPLSPAERTANACISRELKAGRKARLVAALSSIEGDPIVHYLFVRGRRDLLVVVDSRRDRFGSRRWERFKCKGLFVIDGRLGWRNCGPVSVGKPSWLEPVRLQG